MIKKIKTESAIKAAMYIQDNGINTVRKICEVESITYNRKFAEGLTLLNKYTSKSEGKDLDFLSGPFYREAFNSHNFLLTVLIEMGYVGLIAVLIFLWLWYRPALRGPPLLMMPMFAVCVGQILDYFVWQIFFMAFQSFFFAHFASSIYFVNGKNNVRPSEDID